MSVVGVVAGGTINPKTIVSGQQIKCYDNSLVTGSTLLSTQTVINEYVSFTSNGTANLTTVYASYFHIGDTVIFYPAISPLTIGTTYWVVNVGSNFIQVSNELEGTAISVSAGGSNVYPGVDSYSNPGGSYPVLRPFPVATNTIKSVAFTAVSSEGASNTINIPFYMTTSLTKPLVSSTYKDISIFIYNETSATLINRNTSTGNYLFYTNLTFTDYITKIPIAKFTVYNSGWATITEKDLLLAGSALNKKQDNYVVIIVDKCIAWSGKILRSTQSKAGLFTTPVVQSWDIDCEGDISRMQYQEVKTANKGEYYLPVGQVISKLVENSSTVVPYKLINWNGSEDIGLRSSEGLSINYNITDADMFGQFLTLSKSIDFDWRTHLTYLRYAYTYSGGVFTVGNVSPYTTNSFVGRWVIATSVGGGAIYYGKCTSNSTSTITCTISVSVPASGTLLILMDPVLDVVNDLSTPTKVQSFQINTSPSVSVCNGYGFNDKTDRTTLATKIIAKAKSDDGVTVTSNIAAVTPWNPAKCMFENTTTINRRTEGTILNVQEISGGVSGGNYITLEGWGYLTAINRYFAVITKKGVVWLPSTSNYITDLFEAYSGEQRVTIVRSLFVSGLFHKGDTLIFVTESTIYPPTPPFYGYFYVDSLKDVNYTNGMDIFIGGETITTIDSSVDAVFGQRIRYMLDGTAKHRDASSEYTGAHQPGALVWRGSIYDENLSHVENNYSPCYYHGIISKTYMTDINITMSDLETYATLNLIKNSYYYRKGSFWCILFDWFKTDKRTPYEQSAQAFIQVGDTISCLQNTSDTEDDTLYGQPKNLWQVISYTMDANTYKVNIELGDFERNVFTQINDKTSSLHQTIT